MRTLTITLLAWAVASPAFAFHGQADFAAPALEGGGAGMYFSGSPRARGFDCSLCHVDAERRIRLSTEVDPPIEQSYAPATSYRITVRLEAEHRGLDTALNPNTFVFEATHGDGDAAGIFSELDSNVERPPGQELVVARGEFAGVSEWSFTWTSPEAGAGPVTWYLAGVDGDGASDRLGRTGDPLGDDVYLEARRFGEAGSSVPAPMTGAGCAVDGTATRAGWALWLMVCLLAICRRRARSWRAALLVLIVGSGCHDPTLERGPCDGAICGSPTNRPPELDAGRPMDGDTPEPDGGGRVDGGIIELDGCTVDWRCTPWDTSPCDGTATRACTDVGGCGTDVGRPSESRTLPALDENYYRCRVQPIWDRTCSQLACHGSEERPLRIYSRVKWRINELWRGTHNDGGDSALTPTEWACNLDGARAFDAASPDDSELLTQPLRPTAGGLPHAGFTLFQTTSDPDYQTIRMWLSGATLPSCDTGFN